MTTDTIMVRKDVDIIKCFKSKQSSFEANIVSMSVEVKMLTWLHWTGWYCEKSETPFDL